MLVGCSAFCVSFGSGALLSSAAEDEPTLEPGGRLGTSPAALASAVEVNGIKVATLRADSLERGQLRTLVDNLKQRLGEGVVVLGSAQPEGKVAIIAGVTPGLVKRIQAGKLVGAVAKLVGGSGGGKPEIAEAGGKDQAQLGAALTAVSGIVAELTN